MRKSKLALSLVLFCLLLIRSRHLLSAFSEAWTHEMSINVKFTMWFPSAYACSSSVGSPLYDPYSKSSNSMKNQKMAAEPIIVPMVLKMAEFDHKVWFITYNIHLTSELLAYLWAIFNFKVYLWTPHRPVLCIFLFLYLKFFQSRIHIEYAEFLSSLLQIWYKLPIHTSFWPAYDKVLACGRPLRWFGHIQRRSETTHRGKGDQ